VLDQSCGKFNFSLRGTNNQEFILQTKLRLYLERLYPQATSYVLSVKLEDTDGVKSMAVVQEISAEVDGYVEINVADILRPAVKKGKKVSLKVILVSHR